MSLRALAVCLGTTGAALAASAGTAQAADPIGVWLTADQSAKIRVEHCPDVPEGEAHVVLIERAGTPNTGSAGGERTVEPVPLEQS